MWRAINRRAPVLGIVKVVALVRPRPSIGSTTHAGARRRLGTAGISSLEFVVVASVFFTLMLAVMDLGRFFLTKSSLHTLVAGAARSAMIDSLQSNCATYCGAPLAGVALQTLAAPTPFIDPTKLTLNVTRTGGQNAATLTVTASYPYSFALPALSSLWSGQLSASSQISY